MSPRVVACRQAWSSLKYPLTLVFYVEVRIHAFQDTLRLFDVLRCEPHFFCEDEAFIHAAAEGEIVNCLAAHSPCVHQAVADASEDI